MSNEMKLIMESWRSHILLKENESVQVAIDLAMTMRAARQDYNQFNPNAMTIGEMIDLFSAASVKAMVERHSAVKAIIKILLDSIKLMNDNIGIEDEEGAVTTKEDIDELIEIVEDLVEFFQDLSDKISEVESDASSGLFGSLFKKVTRGLSQAVLSFPMDTIETLMKNKIFIGVAEKLGFNAALQAAAELIPFGGTALKAVKSLKTLSGWVGEDSDVAKAANAKNPEEAFKLMTTAAMTVDDSKEDLMGPLSVLDIDDEYQTVLDKSVLADFIKEWVKTLKGLDKNTRLDKLASQDWLERFVKRKYKVDVRKG